MALTAEYLDALSGIQPELRAVLAQLLAELPEAYTLPAASASALGGVKQAANVPAAVGDTPTKAEFDELLTALQNAGIMAGS